MCSKPSGWLSVQALNLTVKSIPALWPTDSSHDLCRGQAATCIILHWFFPFIIFFLLLCRLCKTAMAEQTGKSMILPLKNYTRIDIYHSFKLKGSEFVVWCWCLLLPGLYYYRRLSDFPFLCVPTIASNLVLPYHQPTTLRTKLFFFFAFADHLSNEQISFIHTSQSAQSQDKLRNYGSISTAEWEYLPFGHKTQYETQNFKLSHSNILK